MDRKEKIALWFGCVAMTATGVYAATPSQLIVARQKSYKQIGKATKTITDNLKTANPSIPLIGKNAKVVAALAPKIKTWFPKGTGPETGVKTAALPSIWEQNAKFVKGSDDLSAAANALVAATATNDLAQVRAAAANMGKTCKACHTDFRKKED